MSARDDLLDFLIRYGGRCRDCADEFGVCPTTGIGCGERRRAAAFFVGALEYGSKHKFAAGYRLLAPGELDERTVRRCAEELVSLQRRLESQMVVLDIEREISTYEICTAAIRALDKERDDEV